MRLDELIPDLNGVRVIGDADIWITDIQLDSRRVTEGCLFVAMRGTVVDGHQFIQKAIDAGAAAVLCETLPEELT